MHMDFKQSGLRTLKYASEAATTGILYSFSPFTSGFLYVHEAA